MKKVLVALFCLLLAIPAAYAMKAADYPFYNGEAVENGHLGAQFEDASILLDFDPDLKYSNVYNGSIQACFYTFNEQKTSYMELYLLLPEDITAGITIDPQYCNAHGCTTCSITVDEVESESDDFYTVFSLNGTGYPEGCNYSITIDSVTRESASVTISGSFSATLNKFENNQPSQSFLNISNARFSCTVSIQKSDSVLPETDPTSEPFSDTTQPPFESTEPPTGSIPMPEATKEPAATPTPFAVKV